MKKHLLTKSLSLVLTLSILLSCFGVFTVLADTGTAVASEGTTVLLNRDFEEKKLPNNGFTGMVNKTNSFVIGGDEDNHYLEIIPVADPTGTGDGYLEFNFGENFINSGTGSIVVSADIMFTGSGDFGTLFQCRARNLDGTQGTASNLATVSNGRIYALGKTSYLYSKAISTTEFKTVQFVFTCTSASQFTVEMWYDGSKINTTTTITGQPLLWLRMGIRAGLTSSNEGQSVLVDNMKIYSSTTAVTNPTSISISSSDKGVYYDPNGQDYVYTGLSGDGLFMKVGTDKALVNGVKQTLKAPVKVDGVVYLPVQALAAAVGYSMQISGNTCTISSASDTVVLTVGSKTALVNGNNVSLSTAPALVSDYPVLALDDVSKIFTGVSTGYSNMGLISVSVKKNIIETSSDEELVEIMKQFIFDNVDTSLNKVEAFDVGDMKSTSHPYIIADQAKFDELRDVYNSSVADPTLKAYLESIVAEADDWYYRKTRTYPSSAYSGFVAYALPTQPYSDTDNGYKLNGSVLGSPNGHADNILRMAYAYQITGNVNYALHAYEYAALLGEWIHWGPAHFLECAGTMYPYALAYDILYNVWGELEGQTAGSRVVDRDVIRDALFTKGLMASFYAVHEPIECPWPRLYDGVPSDGSYFSENTNNWNPVCTSGTVAAALALVGDTSVASGFTITKTDYDTANSVFVKSTANVTSIGASSYHSGLTTIQDYAEYLVNKTVYDMEIHGLGLYAPDGSYVESPTYWAYGTTSLFKLAAALEISTGSDFGIMDTWGIDRTCYFALNTQSSDYLTWNYHDTGDATSQNTSFFSYVAYALGDSQLAKIRKIIIKGKGDVASIWDALFYTQDTGGTNELSLQYHMEGIDGYVIRDSWDRGAIYAGIMGGENNAIHGQIDSGSFVYHNNGKIWFGDLGTENYYSYQNGTVYDGDDVDKNGGGRYGYYVMNPEGNNTLVVTSAQDTMHFGQLLYAAGDMYKVYENTHGAYAIIDNTAVYGDTVLSAKRGMLFTNDRKTVVIQDQVVFNGTQSAYWFGHILEDGMISTDGKTAYLSDGETIIRVSIISDNADLKFTMMDAYTFVLDVTHEPSHATTNGYQPEYDRTGDKKLAIACKDVTEINLAVVIEEISLGDDAAVGYEWQDMDSWEPTFDGRQGNETVIDIDAGGDTVGKTETSLGNLTFEYADKDTGIVLNAGTSSQASRYTFKMKSGALAGGYLGDSVVAVEIDVSTLTALPAGIRLSLEGSGGEIAGVLLSDIVTAASKWYRIALMADASNNTVYVYVDGVYHSTIEYYGISFEGLAVTVSTPEGGLASGTSVAIDNVLVRCFNSEYKAKYLGDALVSGGSILNWADRSKTYHVSSPIAVIGSEKYAPDYSGFDSPIIDFETRFVYSVDALISEVGYGEIVSMLKNVNEPIKVSVPCTIYDNGYSVVAYSENLIAKELDGALKFESGSITVTWYDIDGTVLSTESVNASNYVAAPNGSGIDGYGELAEVETEDGRYVYAMKNAWAREMGGEAIFGDDFIVTDKNCSFYLTGSEPDTLRYIVENSSGNIVARYDLSSLMSDFTAGHRRVVLASDVTYDSTTSLGTNLNLYLNGYTLDTTSARAGHMFTVKYSNSANIYGMGGKIVNNSGYNLFYLGQTDGSKANVVNATIESQTTLIDLRFGTIGFTDVDFVMTADSTVFTVQDKSSTGTPTLNIDGCSIRYTSSEYSGAVVYAVGGVVVNISGGSVIDATEATAFSFGGETALIDVNVEDTILNVKKIPDNYEIDVKLGSGTGLPFIPADRVVADGCVVARGSGITNYTIAEQGEYATVIWNAGGTQVVEYWLDGSMPAATSTEVSNALAALTPSSGKKYTYMIPKSVEGGTSVTIEAVEVSAFPVKMNLSLYSSFNVNVYVPVSYGGVTFTGFEIDGVEAIPEVALLEGVEYYKLSVTNITPASAAVPFIFTISFDEGGSACSINISFSILDYIDKILGNPDSYSYEMVTLVANILKYIDAAYRYKGVTDSNYNEVVNLVNKYIFYFRFVGVERHTGILTEITDGIASVQLNLKNIPRIRFNIKNGYTGRISFSYVSYGENVTTTVNVVDGLVDGIEGRDYVELQLRAYDLLGDIEISTAKGTAVYDIGIYYSYHATEQDQLTELLNALFAYCDAAERYNVTRPPVETE